MTRTETVEAYLKTQTEAAREALEAIRALILSVVPEATETINYAILAYALIPGGKRDKQVMVAGYQKHIGFYPQPDTIVHFETALKPYKQGKGSIQFPLSEPMPLDLIREMIVYKKKMLDEA
jgi:uncharacterized protein YdhG (YjbR/CyaY superfamily)